MLDTGDEAIPSGMPDDTTPGLEGLLRIDMGALEESLPSLVDNAVRGPVVLTRNGSDTFVTASLGDIALHMTGFGFALDAAGHLAGGVATSISYSYGAAHGGPFSISAFTPQVPLTTLAGWALNDDVTDFFNAVLGGGDRLGGGTGADVPGEDVRGARHAARATTGLTPW